MLIEPHSMNLHMSKCVTMYFLYVDCVNNTFLTLRMYDSKNGDQVFSDFFLTGESLTLSAHVQRGLQYLPCLCVCLSIKSHLTSGASVCRENAVTYSVGNEDQTVCGTFCCSIVEIGCSLPWMAIHMVDYFSR